MNSIDAVSDRDFVLEFLSANSITAIHLSRLGEEWVLWASEEFGFLTPSDSVSTGSSIMPQKKNPDPMELVRGKSARVVGDLVTLLVLCKGLPHAYNRDLQVGYILIRTNSPTPTAHDGFWGFIFYDKSLAGSLWSSALYPLNLIQVVSAFNLLVTSYIFVVATAILNSFLLLHT